MIEVQIETSGKEITAVTVAGHGGEKKDRDIACAAVSAVTETALAGLLHYGDKWIDWSMEKGFLSIRIKSGFNAHIRGAFNTILTTLSIGLRGIAKEYPNRINIKLKNDSGISDKA